MTLTSLYVTGIPLIEKTVRTVAVYLFLYDRTAGRGESEKGLSTRIDARATVWKQ
ncbi:MAG TPA: hypothetical protein VIP11_01590 [Gemmatimonadaceae bacterium]